jgi:hypothetical protein
MAVATAALAAGTFALAVAAFRGNKKTERLIGLEERREREREREREAHVQAVAGALRREIEQWIAEAPPAVEALARIHAELSDTEAGDLTDVATLPRQANSEALTWARAHVGRSFEPLILDLLASVAPLSPWLVTACRSAAAAVYRAHALLMKIDRDHTRNAVQPPQIGEAYFALQTCVALLTPVAQLDVPMRKGP